jgi:hypothetical protein
MDFACTFFYLEAIPHMFSYFRPTVSHYATCWWYEADLRTDI